MNGFQLSEEEKDACWDVLLKRVHKIDRESKADGTNRGTRRSGGAILLGQKGMSVEFQISQNDGRSKLHLIKAYYYPEHSIRLDESVYWSDNDWFWEPRAKAVRDNPDGYLIVNHQFYTLGSGNGGGFGGRKIRYQRRIEMTGPLDDENSGFVYSETEETRDLWYGGVIPPAWRDRLPDNAVFLDGFDGPAVVYS